MFAKLQQLIESSLMAANGQTKYLTDIFDENSELKKKKSYNRANYYSLDLVILPSIA